MNFTKKNTNNLNKGNIIIVAIVSVFVMLILTTATILTLKNQNMSGNLKEYTARSDIDAIQNEYLLSYSKALKEVDGREDKLTDEYFQNVVPEKYSNDIKATKDGLQYIGNNENVKIIAKDMGLITENSENNENNENNEKSNPNIKEIVLTGSSNNINIFVKLNENIEQVNGYKYNIKKIEDSNWITFDLTKSSTWTMNGLKSDTQYEIQVELIDKSGVKSNSDIYKFKTFKLEIPTFDILNEEFTNKSTLLKINYQSNLDIQKEWSYTGNDYDWNKIKGNDYTIFADKKTKIYARTTDGVNYSEVISQEISNIDKLPPNEFTPTIIDKTATTVTIKGETTDKEATLEYASSGIKGYMFSKDSGVNWTKEQVESEYKFEDIMNQSEIKIKVKAIDNALNETISEEIAVPKTEIVKPLIELVSKGWTNQSAEIKITYSNIAGTLKQYSLDGVNWIYVNELIENINISDNNKTIYARIIDENNNINKTSAFTILNIDKNPPEKFTPVVVSKTKNSIKVIGATLDKATDKSGKSEIKGYQFRINDENWSDIQTDSTYEFINLTQEITYKIQIKAIDNAGNERISEDLNINTSKLPTGDSNIIMTQDKTDWTNTDVIVNISFPDQSNWPLVKLMVSRDNVNWIEYTAPIIVQNNNEYVYAKLMDNENQSSQIYEKKITNIDKTIPVAGTMIMKLGDLSGANYTDNTWTNQSIYLELVNGTDLESGHSETTYEVSGANTLVAGTTTPTTLINDGISNIIVTTKDVTGNIVSQTYTVKIDKTLPIAGTMTMKLGSAAGAAYTDNTWTNQSVYLLPVNGTDTLSGHGTTTYEVSGANVVDAGTVTESTLLNTGISNVTLTTTDFAGNISVRTYTVKIDKIISSVGTMTMKLGSSAGADYTNNSWTNQSIYLAPINGTDIESGNSSTKYAVSGANTVASTTIPTTITTAGISTVTVTTVDVIGNIATRTYTVKIDKTLPIAGTMSMKLGSAVGVEYTDNTWTNQSVYLLPVNGTDALSGHGTTTYSVTGANTVLAGTSQPSILINEGTSNVTLTTVDVSRKFNNKNIYSKD